jgi:hypothetical protein
METVAEMARELDAVPRGQDDQERCFFSARRSSTISPMRIDRCAGRRLVASIQRRNLVR